MKIADGLAVLELKADIPGNAGVMNAVLIWENEEVILVDTGLPGMINTIKDAIEEIGVQFDRLNKIIITHQDLDHIGSLSSILKDPSHKIEVFAHEEEKPYIQGEKIPIKYTPERMAEMEARLNSLPQEKRDASKAMFANLKANVDITVHDGECLPYCGGIKIIHTPGHTPGHICLYLIRYKTLITGDSMNIVNGHLVGPMPQYSYNMEEAMESLKKLTQLDIQTVICYHGGIFSINPNQRILDLINVK